MLTSSAAITGLCTACYRRYDHKLTEGTESVPSLSPGPVELLVKVERLHVTAAIKRQMSFYLSVSQLLAFSGRVHYVMTCVGR